MVNARCRLPRPVHGAVDSGTDAVATGEPGPGWLRGAGPFLTLGMQLALAVVVSFFVGRWLDATFDTTPWLTVIMVLAGTTGGFISFFRTVSAIGKREDQERAERKKSEEHREG